MTTNYLRWGLEELAELANSTEEERAGKGGAVHRYYAEITSTVVLNARNEDEAVALAEAVRRDGSDGYKTISSRVTKVSLVV